MSESSRGNASFQIEEPIGARRLDYSICATGVADGGATRALMWLKEGSCLRGPSLQREKGRSGGNGVANRQLFVGNAVTCRVTGKPERRRERGVMCCGGG